MAMYSVAPELKAYLRTKFAAPDDPYNLYNFGSEVDPITGVNPRLAALMDSADQQTHTDALQVAAAPHIRLQQESAARAAQAAAAEQARRAALPPLPAGARYNFHDDPAKDHSTLYNDFVAKPMQTMKDYGEVARGFVSGLHPKVNPVTRFLDQSADGNIGLRQATKNLASDAAQYVTNGPVVAGQPSKPIAPQLQIQAPAAGAPASGAATTTTPEQTATFPMSNPYAYGLSGAGAGALLGAIMARRGKRGRNALLGAGIGGGAGLLANYLMNSQKKAAYVPPQYTYDQKLHQMLAAYEQHQNEAAKNNVRHDPMTPETAQALQAYLMQLHKSPANMAAGVKPVLRKNMQPDDLDAVDTLMELEDVAPKTASYQKVAGPVGMASNAISTGSAGALLGSLYGALTAPKKKLLRSALRGAIMGGGTGASVGLGMGAFGQPSWTHGGTPEDIEHDGFMRGVGATTTGGLGAALSKRLADEYLPLDEEQP